MTPSQIEHSYTAERILKGELEAIKHMSSKTKEMFAVTDEKEKTIKEQLISVKKFISERRKNAAKKQQQQTRRNRNLEEMFT